jgi:flagellar biogenesis protein FliO
MLANLETLWSRAALAALAQSAADELPPGTGGFGAQLVRSALALLAVCGAALWLVRAAARRGMLGAPSKSAHMTVIDRVALDARRTLHLVRVGKRVLVLGASEEGLRSLAELSSDELSLDEGRKAEALSTSLHGGSAEEDAGSSDAEPKKPRSFVERLRSAREEKSSS